MTMLSRRMGALRAALLLLAAHASHAPRAPAQDAPEPTRDEPRLGVGVGVDAAYTSNLFHQQDRRLDELSNGDSTALGERFHGMQGPEDVVITPGVELGLAWDVGHKRETEVWLGAEYPVHARNGVANYLQLALGAGYDLTRRDTLELEGKLIPSRFKKNYAYAEVAGTRLYDRADYLQWKATLEYQRKWAKRWRTSLGVGVRQRRFDDPFANHDENGYGAVLGLKYDPWKRLRLIALVDLGLTTTPAGQELGITVDRSRHEVEPELGVELDLSHRFDAEVAVAYRIRTYTTDEAMDGTHHERVDRRWTVSAGAGKGFGDHFRLALEASFADSDAGRFDPNDDPDDFGYQELVVGLGVAYRSD